jgi:predicted outer membrane repeat protein
MSRAAIAFVYIALCAAVLTPAVISRADTITVDWAGGGDYLTIQEGIDAAGNDDVVAIAPGTYTGAGNRGLTWYSKNLTIEAESGLGTVTIDGGGVDRAFYLHSTGVDTTTVIRNLIIENGYSGDYSEGGGIIVYNTSPVIDNCIFRDCVAYWNGGAIAVKYTHDKPGPRVRNCVFEGNTAQARGGAIAMDRGSAAVRECLFIDNWTTINTHPSNGGGAINIDYADETSQGYVYWVYVNRCTFVRNSAVGAGAAIRGWNSSATTFVGNCIIAFNTGAGLGIESEPAIDGFTYSIVYGNEGGNVEPGYTTVLEEDPRFCDFYADDFTLCSNSPGLPGNNPYDQLIGYADVGCGDCDTAVLESSWGAIKAMYREER